MDKSQSTKFSQAGVKQTKSGGKNWGGEILITGALKIIGFIYMNLHVKNVFEIVYTHFKKLTGYPAFI